VLQPVSDLLHLLDLAETHPGPLYL
jgi:hypothetical protein